MSILKRIRRVVNYLIYMEYAANDGELGKILGYKSKSSFSQVLNGKVALPKNFIDKLTEIDKNINKVWVYTGEGNILIDTPTEPNATASALEYMIKRVKFLEQENESLKRAVGEDSKHVESGAGTKGSKKSA